MITVFSPPHTKNGFEQGCAARASTLSILRVSIQRIFSRHIGPFFKVFGCLLENVFFFPTGHTLRCPMLLFSYCSQDATVHINMMSNINVTR